MERQTGFYEKYIKRALDIVGSLCVLMFLSWLYVLIALFVRKRLGTPVLFVQPRPGKNEEIFKMYKFRTMTDEKDCNGNLLPDAQRLTPFGKRLRETSLDELPEAFNILLGDMSFIGPRPLLIRDMVFMTGEQRMRHSVRPGLSGLAQVSGRNAITWEQKLDYDLEYIENISFITDLKIFMQTVQKALITHEGITEIGKATTDDLGDYLLNKHAISEQEYIHKQKEAANLLEMWRLAR